MGRALRASAGGIVYHAMNRGNGRREIFHKPGDYDAFVRILLDAQRVVPMRLLGYCLMPNHWHLVLWPHDDGDLSRFVGWVTNTHVKRYREHYHEQGMGHLYQGRFKSFPVEDDPHVVTVLRYAEANALRAGLAERAEGWRWTSFAARLRNDPDLAGLLSEWPVDRPAHWAAVLEEVMAGPELVAIRHSVDRGSPFGTGPWVQRVARLLGLESTLRPQGRPRKDASVAQATAAAPTAAGP